MFLFFCLLLPTLTFGQQNPQFLWKDKFTVSQQENEKLQEKNDQLTTQHGVLRKTYAESKNQLENLTLEYGKLKSENKWLNDENEDLKNEKEALDTKIEQLDSQIWKLNDKNDDLKYDLEQYKKCPVHFEVQTAAVMDADTTANIYMQLHGTSYSFPVIALHDIEHEKSGGYNHGTLDSFYVDFLCSLLHLNNKITHLDVFIAGSDDAWLPAHVTVSSNDGAVYRFNNRDNLWLEVGEGYSTLITLQAE